MMYFWLIVMAIAFVAEMATTALVALWFVIGALFAGVSALLGASILIQSIIFFIVSGVLLVVFLTFFRKKMFEKKTNEDTLIGTLCQVKEEIPERGRGRVLAGFKDWQAEEINGRKVEIGEWVKVEKTRGVTLICSKMSQKN